jgi:hypothetical protein
VQEKCRYMRRYGWVGVRYTSYTQPLLGFSLSLERGGGASEAGDCGGNGSCDVSGVAAAATTVAPARP